MPFNEVCCSKLFLGLILVQGSTHLLLVAQPLTLHDRFVGTEDHRLLRSLCFDLDWGSGGDGADQAPRGQHVWHPTVLLGNADQASFYSSFFQSVCIIGYTLFPLVVAALLSAVHLPMIARIPVYIVLVAWSLAAGISILGGSGVVKNRVGIAVYPLFVFYVGLGCLCFIS